MNKKGITLIEIIVSISLISVVMIFLVSLFLRVNMTYMTGKVNSKYNMLKADIIKAVGDDLENYDLLSAKYYPEYGREKDEAVVFEFDEYRESKLSERIKKVLRVYFEYDEYKISYAYEVDCEEHEDICSDNLTSKERVTTVIRDVPEGTTLGHDKHIEFMENNEIVKIKIPIEDKSGNIYDINIYGVIK